MGHSAPERASARADAAPGSDAAAGADAALGAGAALGSGVVPGTEWVGGGAGAVPKAGGAAGAAGPGARGHDHSVRLVLWRHGQTQWNREGRFQGQSDIPLDPVGEQQAERAARLLAALQP